MIKEKEFSIYDDLKINCKNRNIIVINEELFIKTLYLNHKENYEKINKFIAESFGEDEDYLFHTIIIRKKAIIYVIKAGNRVNKLCRQAKNIKVTPIQFIIKDKLKKFIKKSTWTALIYIFKTYYLLTCEENIIINSYIGENINFINDKLMELNNEEIIYIGKNIDLKILNKNNKYYVIEEEVKESDIFNKRFFTL